MESIETLINQVRKGEILLPEFQRGYVWSSDQVRGLVRSLYRKHPTGHLLVWKTYRPQQVRGSSLNQDGYSLLLLDGQQRLTSLFTLFVGQPPPFYEGERLFFNLYFNVQTEEFRFWQKTIMEGDPSWISVHAFLAKGLHAFIDEIEQLDEPAKSLYLRNLGRLSRLDAIRTYPYAVDRLEGEDLTVEEVVDIFNRVNSAGTPLRKTDLALAHVCSIWPEAREQMRLFAREMNQIGFGIDLGFLVQCVAAVAADSVLLEGNFYRVPAEDLQLAWKKVRDSFEHLVNVLKHDAYIDHLSDLQSPYVLIPLTVYLARNGSTFKDDGEKCAFLRWLYLASIWTRYSGSTATKLQKDVAVLGQAEPATRLVEAIIQERGRIRLDAKDVEGRGGGSAMYKMGYVVARARGAKDWFSGIRLYSDAVGKSNGLESHHIFPKKLAYDHLQQGGYIKRDQGRFVNEVANRAFLTQKANRKIAAKPPADYLPEVELQFPGALRAQAVPMDRTLWELENFEHFLAKRRQLLADSINEFLDELIGDSSEATAVGTEAIRDLILQGEHGQLEFKSTLRWDVRENRANKELERVIAKSVGGFLNSRDGGVLLIGVSDDGTVVGLEHDYKIIKGNDRDGFENHLTQVMARLLGESALTFVSASFHNIDGHDVCQITIEPSDHPVYLAEGTDSSFYLRTGNSTRPLPTHEVVKYVATRWGGV